MIIVRFLMMLWNVELFGVNDAFITLKVLQPIKLQKNKNDAREYAN